MNNIEKDYCKSIIDIAEMIYFLTMSNFNSGEYIDAKCHIRKLYLDRIKYLESINMIENTEDKELFRYNIKKYINFLEIKDKENIYNEAVYSLANNNNVEYLNTCINFLKSKGIITNKYEEADFIDKVNYYMGGSVEDIA